MPAAAGQHGRPLREPLGEVLYSASTTDRLLGKYQYRRAGLTPAGRDLAQGSGLLVSRGWVAKAGDGRQFVAWIHFENFIRAVQWLIDTRSSRVR